MTPELRMPHRIGIVESSAPDDAVLYVASLPDGPIVVLRDTALTIWREAVSLTRDQDLAERVASLYGVSVSDVRAEVDACAADLVERGVLEVVAIN